MNTNTENHQEKFVCIMSLPQEQAFDILRNYEDQGIDYVSLELQREFWIYDVLVPESRMFDIQPFTDSYFAASILCASATILKPFALFGITVTFPSAR